MNLVESLCAHRLLAIVRGKDPEAALRTVCVLAESGIEAVEVSLTTTDAPASSSGGRAPNWAPTRSSAPARCGRPLTPPVLWTRVRRTS